MAALESVRLQTYPRIETIVVLDAPDHATFVQSLLSGNERLEVTLGRQGGANARNVGLNAATGAYVSFLDDDDWWEKSKVEDQLSAMIANQANLSWTSTYFHETGNTVRILPKKLLPPHESVGDYVIRRKNIKHGAGYIQTSSLMLTSELARRHRWSDELLKHQDWDFLIRLSRDSLCVTYAMDSPLVHVAQGSARSVSQTVNLDSSIAFLNRHARFLQGRTVSDFIFTQIVSGALESRRYRSALRYFTRGLYPLPHLAAMVIAFRGLIRGVAMKSGTPR